jgi:hypothetical protein
MSQLGSEGDISDASLRPALPQIAEMGDAAAPQVQSWTAVSPATPRCLCKGAEVCVIKTNPKSIPYENRTKSAKCGGLETNGPRENFGAEQARRSAEVCARRPWLLAISARQNPAENVGRGRTGGGRGTVL